MRITRVEAIPLAAPLPAPLGGSARRPPLRARETLIVRLWTDEGLLGYGECSGPPAILAGAVTHLGAAALGAHPLERNTVLRVLRARAREEGSGGLLFAALSGIDLALWDLAGKALGVRAVDLLGGPLRTTFPAYAASVYFSTPKEAAEVARHFVTQGFRAIKVKIGLDLEGDLARLRAVQGAVGDSRVQVLLDANGGYGVGDLVRLASELPDLPVGWLEEPVPASDLEGYRLVQRRLRLRLAGGEALHGRAAFAPWLTRRAVDVAMPDLGRCGGLTEAWAIAAMAEAFGVTVSPHSWGHSVALAAALQLAAALPSVEWLEEDAHPNPLREALLGDHLAARDGHLRLPEGPGLGVEIDDQALEQFRVPASTAVVTR